MYGDGPCVVLERAGPTDLAFLEGGHHLFVVNQQTYFVLGKLAQLALHNPHIWANSLKPVCFLCFLLFWCPLLPFIETGTLKIYTKMVLYMKNEFLTSNSMGG